MGGEGGSKYYQTERTSLIMILALFKAGFKIGWEDDKISHRAFYSIQKCIKYVTDRYGYL